MTVRRPGLSLVIGVLVAAGGCTSLQEFVHNGFVVGPNYQRPPAPLAPNWIDAANPQVVSAPANYGYWWSVFRDPVLNNLVRTAYDQNVNLRVAATRVLQARAQRAIAVGTLFPQQQTASGGYTRVDVSRTIANVPPRPFFDDWAAGLNLSWEIDFWGKIRRTIESTDALTDASIDDYDNVMVTLVSDVAAAYVQYRVLQQQLEYTRRNVELQRGLLKIATAQWKAGGKGELPVVQSTSLLQQLESLIPVQEIGLRQANNQLCTLLGMPPRDLTDLLGIAPIPESPQEVVAGVPADLVRRRPDLRAAERQVAAQNAQIGVAEANFYPALFISGTLGYEAQNLPQVWFNPKSFAGAIGPGFQWNILNYGRILNNVRLQDSKTQELVAVYQQKVLTAAQEVEAGIVSFLNTRREAEKLAGSVKAAERAVALTSAQLDAGAIDFTPVFVAAQFLAQDQISYAQAQGDIALGLIAVYRAIGGGWEVRLAESAANCRAPAASFGTPRTAPPDVTVSNSSTAAGTR